MRLEVFVPGPIVGLNQTYKTGRGRFYKSAEATSWASAAALIIGAEAGEASWFDGGADFSLSLTLSRIRHDIDAPLKLVQDVLADKLGFDDERVSFVGLAREDLGRQGWLG